MGRTTVVATCIFVLALVVAMEVQRHREGPQNADAVAVLPQSPEAQLAASEPRDSAPLREAAVRRLTSFLDVLAADCPADTRRDLAGLALAARKELGENGIAATPSQVLGGVVGVEDIGRLPHCASYFERYVATRLESAAAQP